MLQGFKEFILRGNVVDLAVGVVIGSAFATVVTALTDNFIAPLLALLGDPEVGGLAFQLRAGDEATTIDLGAFISALINFLLVAAVIYFLVVMPMNKIAEAQKRRQGIDPEAEDPTETELLSEIRDLLATNGAATTRGSIAPETGLGGTHRSE